MANFGRVSIILKFNQLCGRGYMSVCEQSGVLCGYSAVLWSGE